MIIMENLEMPIQKIGERGWKSNLKKFLENYDIEVLPLDDKDILIEAENRLGWKLPKEMKDFYLNFRETDNTDFMSNLYPLDELVPLSGSSWGFVLSEYPREVIDKYIVFAESPATDPLCIDKDNYEIVLFSHDPLTFGKVFNNFNDYLINEIISIQELLGELEFEEGEKKSYMAELLSGENIDFDFRHEKLE